MCDPDADADAVFEIVERLTARGYRVEVTVALDGGNSLRLVGEPAPKDEPERDGAPSVAGVCGHMMGWAGYTNVCELPTGHEGVHSVSDASGLPTTWHEMSAKDRSS